MITSVSASNIDQALQLAIDHHRAGRLPEAESIYRQILAAAPQHADALYLLGTIEYQQGRNHIAVGLIEKAIQLNPNWPAYYHRLGDICRLASRLDQAIDISRAAINRWPDLADAHRNLGNALLDKGELAEAVQAYRAAIQLEPASAENYYNLGIALLSQKQIAEAIDAYRSAIRLNPDYAAAYSNLGLALAEQGDLDQAIVKYETAIQLMPDHANPRYNLANALRAKGQLEQAILAYQAAIQLQPDYAEAHHNLGVSLFDQCHDEEAIAHYRTAVQLQPNYPEAYYNLGIALFQQGRPDDAIAAYRTALQQKPDYAEAHSGLLFTMIYNSGDDQAAIADEARSWGTQHAGPLAHLIRPLTNDRAPDRRLKIGYVSPDLREHAVARFLLPLLSAHDHQKFEVFAYAQVPTPDTFTQQIQNHCDHWRSIVNLTDDQAAKLIRDDRIDILVDLAGHTLDNRLLLFARRPALIQVSYLGYPSTTGLSTMDYRLTDVFADPPELAQSTDPHYSERLIRLSPSAWCWQMEDASPTGTRSNGPITFGSFNHLAKLTQPMLRCWAGILRAVPQSRLLLKSAWLRSSSVRKRIHQSFVDEGIAPQRIELLGALSSHANHLALYRQVDIALDTFPYHGTTTTCEALWMGVPVITLAGHSHVSRVGVSLLSNIGLPECVAHSEREYADIAKKLVADPQQLATLHATLRARMKASPLTDAPRLRAQHRSRLWPNVA